MSIQAGHTAADLERQLAAARARLAEILADLAAAEAERAVRELARQEAERLANEAGAVVLRLGHSVDTGAALVIVAPVTQDLDPWQATDAQRAYEQAHAGWQLAREDLDVAHRAYQAANQRCGDLLNERGQLEYRVSVLEAEATRLGARDEQRQAHVAEARGWLDKLRARVDPARA